MAGIKLYRTTVLTKSSNKKAALRAAFELFLFRDFHYSFSTAIPGSSLPSIYSSNAPPPVDTYETLSP